MSAMLLTVNVLTRTTAMNSSSVGYALLPRNTMCSQKCAKPPYFAGSSKNPDPTVTAHDTCIVEEISAPSLSALKKHLHYFLTISEESVPPLPDIGHSSKGPREPKLEL